MVREDKYQRYREVVDELEWFSNGSTSISSSLSLPPSSSPRIQFHLILHYYSLHIQSPRWFPDKELCKVVKIERWRVFSKEKRIEIEKIKIKKNKKKNNIIKQLLRKRMRRTHLKGDKGTKRFRSKRNQQKINKYDIHIEPTGSETTKIK